MSTPNILLQVETASDLVSFTLKYATVQGWPLKRLAERAGRAPCVLHRLSAHRHDEHQGIQLSHLMSVLKALGLTLYVTSEVPHAKDSQVQEVPLPDVPGDVDPQELSSAPKHRDLDVRPVQDVSGSGLPSSAPASD